MSESCVSGTDPTEKPVNHPTTGGEGDFGRFVYRSVILITLKVTSLLSSAMEPPKHSRSLTCTDRSEHRADHREGTAALATLVLAAGITLAPSLLVAGLLAVLPVSILLSMASEA